MSRIKAYVLAIFAVAISLLLPYAVGAPAVKSANAAGCSLSWHTNGAPHQIIFDYTLPDDGWYHFDDGDPNSSDPDVKGPSGQSGHDYPYDGTSYTASVAGCSTTVTIGGNNGGGSGASSQPERAWTVCGDYPATSGKSYDYGWIQDGGTRHVSGTIVAAENKIMLPRPPFQTGNFFVGPYQVHIDSDGKCTLVNSETEKPDQNKEPVVETVNKVEEKPKAAKQELELVKRNDGYWVIRLPQGGFRFLGICGPTATFDADKTEVSYIDIDGRAGTMNNRGGKAKTAACKANDLAKKAAKP